MTLAISSRQATASANVVLPAPGVAVSRKSLPADSAYRVSASLCQARRRPDSTPIGTKATACSPTRQRHRNQNPTRTAQPDRGYRRPPTPIDRNSPGSGKCHNFVAVRNVFSPNVGNSRHARGLSIGSHADDDRTQVLRTVRPPPSAPVAAPQSPPPPPTPLSPPSQTPAPPSSRIPAAGP